MSNKEYACKPLNFTHRTIADLESRSAEFLQHMRLRRTVRDFAATDVPETVIENAIMTAGSAPSGANMQPWFFVAVRDAAVKKAIRIAAEKEERELYDHRASDEWLEALAPLRTNAEKTFLETAPWLIAVFAQKHTIDETGRKLKHYYTPESVGIATGMLITALHHAGLATLTHTPSPMSFLRDILGRPVQEKPFLLLVTGYPAENTTVPDISKKASKGVMNII